MRKHHGPCWWKWNKRTRKKEKKRKSTCCMVCFFNRCWKTSPLALLFAGKLHNVKNKFGRWGGNVYYVMVQLFLLFIGKEWSDMAASKEIKLETKHNTSVADMNKTNQWGQLIKMYFAVFFLFWCQIWSDSHGVTLEVKDEPFGKDTDRILFLGSNWDGHSGSGEHVIEKAVY